MLVLMVLMECFQFIAKQLFKKNKLLKCTLLKKIMPKCNVGQMYPYLFGWLTNNRPEFMIYKQTWMILSALCISSAVDTDT